MISSGGMYFASHVLLKLLSLILFFLRLLCYHVKEPGSEIPSIASSEVNVRYFTLATKKSLWRLRLLPFPSSPAVRWSNAPRPIVPPACTRSTRPLAATHSGTHCAWHVPAVRQDGIPRVSPLRQLRWIAPLRPSFGLFDHGGGNWCHEGFL